MPKSRDPARRPIRNFVSPAHRPGVHACVWTGLCGVLPAAMVAFRFYIYFGRNTGLCVWALAVARGVRAQRKHRGQ
eukprot:4287946-Prymnesium_polylepis.1